MNGEMLIQQAETPVYGGSTVLLSGLLLVGATAEPSGGPA